MARNLIFVAGASNMAAHARWPLLLYSRHECHVLCAWFEGRRVTRRDKRVIDVVFAREPSMARMTSRRALGRYRAARGELSMASVIRTMSPPPREKWKIPKPKWGVVAHAPGGGPLTVLDEPIPVQPGDRIEVGKP